MSRILSTYIFIIAALQLSLTSCTGFLSVDPSDQIMEDKLFTSETGFVTALNGVYTSLNKSELYSQTLTCSTFDIMAQYYDVYGVSNHKYGSLGRFLEQPKKSAVSTIWESAYNLILQLNVINYHLEHQDGVLSDRAYNIIKGEVLGLRALLHFELFRIFGPIYSKEPGRDAIPYMTTSIPTGSPMLKAAEVKGLIYKDLNDAMALLEEYDPIITEGKLDFDVTHESNAFRYRNFRFNYYAVKALAARVALYVGDKQTALEHATDVIEQAGESCFPFATASQVNGEGTESMEDRVFSSESIFAVYNVKRTVDTFDAFFSNRLDVSNLLSMSENGYNNLYPQQSDLRIIQWRVLKDMEYNDRRIFVKYGDVTSNDKRYPYMIPVLKISEMYLIAAECESDSAKAYGYLNALRGARQTSQVQSLLNNNIEDEYMREFIGEGELFWYYKRKAATIIPSLYDRRAADVDMPSNNYMFVLPDSEIAAGA